MLAVVEEDAALAAGAVDAAAEPAGFAAALLEATVAAGALVATGAGVCPPVPP